MPRFYFDLTDADGFHADEIGDDLPDFEEARAQVQRLLPDVAREELPDGDLHVVTCDVRDETGRTVYRGTITFRGTRDPA